MLPKKSQRSCIKVFGRSISIQSILAVPESCYCFLVCLVLKFICSILYVYLYLNHGIVSWYFQKIQEIIMSIWFCLVLIFPQISLLCPFWQKSSWFDNFSVDSFSFFSFSLHIRLYHVSDFGLMVAFCFLKY